MPGLAQNTTVSTFNAADFKKRVDESGAAMNPATSKDAADGMPMTDKKAHMCSCQDPTLPGGTGSQTHADQAQDPTLPGGTGSQTHADQVEDPTPPGGAALQTHANQAQDCTSPGGIALYTLRTQANQKPKCTVDASAPETRDIRMRAGTQSRPSRRHLISRLLNVETKKKGCRCLHFHVQ
jgi:hypothetical protein